ncbi:DUF1302 family protein [Accumulibacter sp.]|uniref:DUF1302 family protein n=1 Tax=Accumulibacter sp. TaxID=2053492 RepID=UPI0025F5BDB7|nr:DUF1302 family protein [Accumulibacter sp.]MCM8595274.1 hypothetical protein [Accumulibacter sp.]MCM8627743.1 hypothetical protein [Accumulibacter sp.]MDS4049420.1 DUF1302 family protein [Accumulibacter sp.]
MSLSHSLPILGGAMLLVAATDGALAHDADPAAWLVPVASASPAIPGLLLAAQSGRSLPGSRDALFGDDEELPDAGDSGGRESPAAEEEPGQPEVRVPASRDALFGDGDETAASVATAGSSAARFAGVRGFFQNVMAYTWPEPRHWSEMMNRVDLAAQGELAPNVRWKLGARVDYDATYTFTNFYPQAVADDQRFNVLLRENYLDIGAGDWDFRLGRQQIVWGEMVGLLFGDVVSAKDMRQFILPRFEILRIPQWAARAEYFKDDVHAELVWIPVASYDNIGKPGSEFYAYTPPPPPGVNAVILSEKFPARTLSNTNYGLRLSVLRDGWDVAGFAYSSMSVAPSFYREIIVAPQPTIIYQARHDRINQFGSTVAKDFGSVVLKGEAVYTRGRRYEVTNPTDSDGVVAQNAFTWVVGLDFNPTADTRINTQVFQNHIFDRDPYIIPSANEYGFSLLVNQKIGDKVEVQALWIASLNRTDWMLRPRVSWNFEKNWGFAFGVDIFEGQPLGYFGRYDAKDRVYTELQYNF